MSLASVLTGSLSRLVDQLEKAGFVDPADLASLAGPNSEDRLRELEVPIPLRRSLLVICSQQAEADGSAENISTVPDHQNEQRPIHDPMCCLAVWLCNDHHHVDRCQSFELERGGAGASPRQWQTSRWRPHQAFAFRRISHALLLQFRKLGVLRRQPGTPGMLECSSQISPPGMGTRCRARRAVAAKNSPCRSRLCSRAQALSSELLADFFQ